MNNNGKDEIGSFILAKSKEFDFSHKNIFLMNKLLVGMKEKFKPQLFSKISGATALLFYILRDALEFCGVLVTEKTQKIRIYDNLIFYKNIIDNLERFIDFLSQIDVS